MIVADIMSFLGNQLFIYAATKSIALDLGYQYRYRVLKQPLGLAAFGHEYCEKFEHALHIDTSEKISIIPPAINHKWTYERLPTTFYRPEVYKISDNTHLCGHFISPEYFQHRRQEVLEWFGFQDKYLDLCRAKREKIVELTGSTHLVSVHMRYDKDYRLHRMTIDPCYYQLAMQKIRHDFYGERLCFLLFSNSLAEAKRLLKCEDVVVPAGTMFEDLCLMSLCDSHIVPNSTFSWWGAWLAHGPKGEVIRPSIVPVPEGGYGPDDWFPSDWVAVEATRERLTPRILVNRIRDEYPFAVAKTLRKPFNFFKRLLKRFILGMDSRQRRQNF